MISCKQVTSDYMSCLMSYAYIITYTAQKLRSFPAMSMEKGSLFPVNSLTRRAATRFSRGW